MKDKKRKLILPPHTSKQFPPTLPGMTVADAEEAEKPAEAEEVDDDEDDEEVEVEEEVDGDVESCDTSEDSDSNDDDGDDLGEGDAEGIEDKDTPSATKKIAAQPEIVVLSEDEETECESGR